MMPDSIYDWVTAEEKRYETEDIKIGDNWYWNMRKHVQMIFHLMHGQFYTGLNNWTRAFKALMQPILDLCNWTEDIDVKEVQFFVEGGEGEKVLSFLVKKYHDEIYTREHDLDALFDQITDSDNTYGGLLVQPGPDMPEVIPIVSIAFCDQSDVKGAPIAFKHVFSPTKLKSMSKVGWGDEKNGATISLDDLVVLACEEVDGQNKTSGKVVEVYVIKGDLPEDYLLDNGNTDDVYNQIQVVAFYTNKENKRVGVTLYRKEANDDSLMFFSSNPVYRRGLGYSVGEMLMGPQIWSNFLEIHKTNLLESASKVPLYTDDDTYTTKNKIQDMENLEITTIADGKTIQQVPTAAPANINLLSSAVNEWFQHAQFSGAAFDPILGKEPNSGTTFRGQERTVAQGSGSHKRKQGIRAKWIEEIYRAYILPDIKKQILKGHKFWATLTTNELTWVAEQMATVESNQIIKDAVLYHGQPVTAEEQAALIAVRKSAILKKGNRQLVEILKGEFEDVEIKMGINVAGKQKDLAGLSDKVLSIFQFALANGPAFQQAMQTPALANAFENILEFGGLSIGDFSSLLLPPTAPTTPAAPTAPQDQAMPPTPMMPSSTPTQ